MNTRGNRFYIETFGCQMNVSDSEKVAGLLLVEGHERVSQPGEADFVFINTCAVREKAADKLFHALGRIKHLKTDHPGLRVGVGGCVAQLEGARILKRAPQVDVLVGTHNFGRVPELLRQAREDGRTAVDLDRAADPFGVSPNDVAHSNPVRAYVTAMEGCNRVCSFCVVPRTRGPEVCRPPEAIVSEVRSLVERGFAEVMLLGQTVNAYRFRDVDFAGLLERVQEIEGLLRLRFTTSHPSHVSPRLAAALRDLPKLCPHLHLPVQSGSDAVLASMRRGYDRREYLDTVRLLHGTVPELALSSDVIVGYPGETEDDFQATLDLVEEVRFDGLFIFAYSPRPGTTAARLADDVPEGEKLRRLHVLNDYQQRAQALRNRERVGSREQVLVDKVDAPNRVSGRTRHFRTIHLDAPERLVGSLVTVEVVGGGANTLTGRLIEPTVSLTGASSVPIL